MQEDLVMAVLFDRLFGTYYLPEDKWPAGYGIQGHPVPRGYLAQFKHPFRRKKARPASETAGSANSAA